jgi:hypothetical protein
MALPRLSLGGQSMGNPSPGRGGREVDGIEEAVHKGEMHVSRPAVDTLFVWLSRSWRLQSKVPTAASKELKDNVDS